MYVVMLPKVKVSITLGLGTGRRFPYTNGIGLKEFV